MKNMRMKPKTIKPHPGRITSQYGNLYRAVTRKRGAFGESIGKICV